MRFLFIILMLFYVNITYSQSNYYLDGYIVQLEGDTVFGKIKDTTPIKSASKVKFMAEDGKKKTYTSNNLIEYKRGEELFFRKICERPFYLGSKAGFMKIIENGTIKLFEFNYWWRSPDISIAKTDYYIEVDDKFVLVKQLGFKNKMPKYFIDNDALVDKIKQEKLKYNDLKEIIKIYNRGKF